MSTHNRTGQRVAKPRGKEAEIEQRRTAISNLLKSRVSYRDIAKVMGVSLGTVASDVKALFEQWSSEQIQNVEEQAMLDLATMNDALRAIMQQIRGGDLQCIDRMVRILERRARMLGYDRPQKIDTGDTVLRIVLPEGFPEQTPEAMPAPVSVPVLSPTGQPPAIPAPTDTAQT